MKEMIKNIGCFVTFDEPFKTDAINMKFKSLHEYDKAELIVGVQHRHDKR